MFKKEIGGVVPMLDNVKQVLRDKDGNVKSIFQENSLGQSLLKMFRKLWPDPIDEGGQVKKGITAYLSAYGLRVPFITGSWGQFRLAHNLITTTGKAGAASRINGAGSEAAFTAIGIGIGTTAANVADTAMETGKKADGTADSGVHALATGSVTASRVTTTVTNDTAQLVGTIAFTAGLAVTESGVFNADTNGVMLCRQVFSAINVVSGDSLELTWKVKAS